MDDLISRQQAIDELVKMLSDCFYADEEVLDAAETTLKELPPAQPEIIRCKDCKWWDRYNDYKGYCMAAKSCTYTTHWDIQIRRTYDGDFYCAHAELKEECEDSTDRTI